MNTTLPPLFNHNVGVSSINLSSTNELSNNFTNTMMSTSNQSYTENTTTNKSIDKPKVKQRRKTKTAEQKKLASQLNSAFANNQINNPFNTFNNQINNPFNNQTANNSNFLANGFLNLMSNQLNGTAQFGNSFTSSVNDGQFKNQLNGQVNSALNGHTNGLFNGTSMNHDQIKSQRSPNNNTRKIENSDSSFTNKHNAINQQFNGSSYQQQQRPSNPFIQMSRYDQETCRPMLCDQNGIVLAEIIYRCTICKAIHEYQADARLHYYMKHINSEEGPRNLNNNLSNLVNLNLNGLTVSGSGLGAINNGGSLVNGLANGNGFATGRNNSNNVNQNKKINPQINNFQLNLQNNLNSISRLSHNSMDKLYNDESTNNSNVNNNNDQMNDENMALSGLFDKLSKQSNRSNQLNSKTVSALNMLANGAALASTNNNSLFQADLNNLNLNSFPQQQLCINNFYPNDQQQKLMNMTDGLVDDEGFFSNNSSSINTNQDTTSTSGKSGRSSESCTKTGYINCPVCNSIRYYTTLQRRYGQFTCVACYRFFKEFFQNPTIYICASLSECKLDCKQKCKACWINSCMKVYTVDSKREDTLKKYKPVKSIDEAQLIEGQLSINENAYNQSFSHTDNNTPTSMMNDDDDLEDDSNSFEEEESFPLDFTTKKLIDSNKTQQTPTNEMNSSTELTTNSNSDNNVEKINKNDDTSNNNTSNESKSDDHPMEETNEFALSLHKFMQSGQIGQVDTTIDWNNNSIPASNPNDELCNGLPGAEDLNALNLVRTQENDGSPAKKRERI